ncbi:MAG: hypothetical protein MZV70_13240 [Desulfobacterales bacterium]|nr:hypothetical protein [Desulfobacterales bacterium]
MKNRMKIWRQLANSGAVQLKGAVYLLPYSEEHYEFFEWIVSEATDMGGEGGFVRVDSIETMSDDELIRLFDAQRETEYGKAGKALDDLELKLGSIRKGTPGAPDSSLADEMARLTRDFESIEKEISLRQRPERLLSRRLQALQREIRNTLGYVYKDGRDDPRPANYRPKTGRLSGKDVGDATTSLRGQDGLCVAHPELDRQGSGVRVHR